VQHHVGKGPAHLGCETVTTGGEAGEHGGLDLGSEGTRDAKAHVVLPAAQSLGDRGQWVEVTESRLHGESTRIRHLSHQLVELIGAARAAAQSPRELVCGSSLDS
jgi:hypothetical protein